MVVGARRRRVGLAGLLPAGFLLAGSLLGPIGTARAASPFDGTYVGTQRETANNHSGYCDNLNRDDIRRQVKDGVITTVWSKATLRAPIASDGSFAVTEEGMQFGKGGGQPNPITFKGTIRDGKLEADVGGSRCAAHWSLRKS